MSCDNNQGELLRALTPDQFMAAGTHEVLEWPLGMGFRVEGRGFKGSGLWV